MQQFAKEFQQKISSKQYGELERRINSNKNRNTRFVHIKLDRTCMLCRRTIRKGSKALTINKYQQGRHWICLGCALKGLVQGEQQKVYLSCPNYQNMVRTLVTLNNIPFDDEGMAYACYDSLEEYAEVCEKCNKCDIILELEGVSL